MVSNAEYEWPWLVADTFEEMAEWLRSVDIIAHRDSFRKSASGIICPQNGAYKYLRINANTGSVIIGAEYADPTKARAKAF